MRSLYASSHTLYSFEIGGSVSRSKGKGKKGKKEAKGAGGATMSIGEKKELKQREQVSEMMRIHRWGILIV
jgi:hypothetical protein